MFELGREYNRQRDLHDIYGGNRQSGISPCSEYPIIFLFTSEEGVEYGYDDKWENDSIFVYTGEGQIGDMEMVRGNKSLRSHKEDGRNLHLFKKMKSGTYKYLGEFEYIRHEYSESLDSREHKRRTIKFILKKK